MDFLKFYSKKYPFDINEIEKIFSGEKYTAVLLKNGNIGVCANLLQKFDFSDLSVFNLNKIKYRVLYQAFLNAKLNYRKNLSGGDLFDFINFEKYQRIVMIGFFKPVYDKLLKMNKIPVFFDFRDIEGKAEQYLQKDYLQRAEIVIISATTLFNSTLSQILENSNGKNYLLGPSALFDEFLLEKGLNAIFGTVFSKNDFNVLDIISKDGGTKDFQKFGLKKIFFK